jgi:tetratricopeptide (TPR) repeat protein
MPSMILRKNRHTNFIKNILLTLICVILLSCTAFSQNEDKFIKKGRKFMQKEKYAEAKIEFTNALKISPKNINTLIYRSLILAELKEYQESIDDISKVLKLGYTPPSLYLRRANNYHEIKQDSNALIDINKFLVSDTNSLMGLYLRGNVYLSLKKYPSAIKDYTTMLNNKLKQRISSKGFNYIYINRAKAYYEEKEFKKALTDFNQIIANDSNYSFAYRFRIRTLFRLEKYKECIKHCDAYFKVFKKQNTLVLRYKVMSLKKLKQYDEALITLKRLLEEFPEDNIAYNSRADIKLITGDFESGMKDVDISLSHNPKYIPALLTKSELLFELKDYESMCIYYNKAIDFGFKPTLEQLIKIRGICEK